MPVMEDRVLSRNGELVRMSQDELENLMHVAFDTALWTALKQLGADDSNELDSIGADGQFGNDRVTVCVKLKDGREATASASLWPEATRAN